MEKSSHISGTNYLKHSSQLYLRLSRSTTVGANTFRQGVVTTGLWVNKGATDEHLTRYLYTESDETRLVHKYILKGLADEGARFTLNRQDS